MGVFLWLGMLLTLVSIGRAAESDVDAIAALVSAPPTSSAVIAEIFERTERLLDSNSSSTHSVSRQTVRAVIREQMRRGNFADVPKTIDRIFPPGAEKKEVAADAAAIFGRFDGRDLCLETWALGCTQYGKLADAMTVANSIEELKRRNAAISKMTGVLIGKDVKATVLYGLVSDTMLGGDTPDKDIPAPKYSDAELLEFCRWYAATAEQMPYTNAKIQQTASAAGLMSRFGFKKEADELFDKAFADVLATEESNRIYAVAPIVGYRAASDEVDTVLDFIEKLPEHGVNVPVHQKVTWFCAMGKFDEALALVKGNSRYNYLLGNVVSALIAADRKADAREILEIMLASEDMFPDIAIGGNLVRGGMIDEAFRYVERFPNAECRATLLRLIALQQWKDGNTAEADKTLLEAVKQVEQMNPEAVGNWCGELKMILQPLTTDPKALEQLMKQFQ